ncbi:F-box/kelch-repeat protein At3g23880-like [Argentina anserina]|uniref:F-box/kelch-repeat protein At3g23880-like n=1 Tax=Argentina anserina TaxID=57926 RepID=UPI00217659BD|nr:F-box/kelch-repeat protein At3g23880-like [Potentilla anserina]
MSDYLPVEVITNILLRLPAKSLVICTSVCKSWRSMIKDSSFIGAHHSRTIDSNNRHGTHLLLLHRFYPKDSSLEGRNSSVDGVKNDVYSLHYDNSSFDDCCEIGLQCPIAERGMHNECFRVVGVCNGLVCLADDLECYGYTFLIWNPSIRKVVTLPSPGLTFQTVGGYDAYHGFAFDAVTKDYKVVRIVEDQYGWNDKEAENRTFVEVYSLAASSWSSSRLIDPQCGLSGIRSPSAFVNGALHWDAHGLRSSTRRYFILAFDVGSELFQEIMMPKCLDWDSLCLGGMTLRSSVSGDGNSLALFVRCSSDSNADSLLDVWVMKEYCVEESWTKLTTLRPPGPEGNLHKALCFRKSGEVVMICNFGWDYYGSRDAESELVSLDLVSGHFKNLGICRYKHYTMDPYEESLVLLDRSEAVSC